MEQELLYIIEDALNNMLTQSMLSLLISVLGYVFTALGLYTIAQRRVINNPWLAWIPLANVWILGSISDQYQYVVKGKNTNRRIILLAAEILAVVLGVVASAMAISTLGLFFRELAYGGSLENAVGHLGATLIVTIPLTILAVVGAVVELVCLYDLFISCDRNNGLLFFILCIIPGINSICKPVFLLVCRNKDSGMPSRKRRRSSSWDDEDGFGGNGRGRDSWDDE